jgi:HlyD family secretion protein
VLSLVGAARLVLQPDERDLSLIQLGLKARASADAYPHEAFDAEVTYVAPSVEVTRGTIEVRLRVPSPPAYLRPDMTVSVDLIVATRKQTLVVPSDAVRGFATATPWTLVVVGNRAERRDLSLGIRGDGAVEVISGLVDGDAVVLPDGQLLQPGQRLRPFRKGS